MIQNVMQDYVADALIEHGCKLVIEREDRLCALYSIQCGAANKHTFDVGLWLNMKKRDKKSVDDWRAAAVETAQEFNPTRRLIELAEDVDDSDDLRCAIDAFDALNVEFVQKLPEIVHEAASAARAEQFDEIAPIVILARRITNYEPYKLLALAGELDLLEIKGFSFADYCELEMILEQCTKDELIEVIMDDLIDPQCDMARRKTDGALESVTMDVLYAEAKQHANEIAMSVACAIVQDGYAREFARYLHSKELELIDEWGLMPPDEEE